MDIERKRGDTYPIEITVLSDGVALDITGASFILTVDPVKAPTDALNNLCQLTGVITDAAAGEVSFTPTANQMSPAGKYYFDIQMTDASGAKRTIDAGKFVLTQDITKD
jgi:BppU N-terminal domain